MSAVDPVAAQDQRLAERLTRLEQQIRSFRELHVSEVGDLARQLQTLVTLHADELQLVQDELGQILTEVVARMAGVPASVLSDAPHGDPAAGSPKRAAWLAAEEQRRAPKSRRELLFGAEHDRKDDPGAAST